MEGERTVCCPDVVDCVSATRPSGGKTVAACVARQGLKEDFMYLFTFFDFKQWHFDNCIYLAVFNAMFVNVFILVVAVLT